MRRHELDPVSLLWGLFFLGVAVTVAIAEGSDTDVEPGWVLAAALVALGGVGLTVAAAGMRRRRERAPAAGVPAGPMFSPDSSPSRESTGGTSDAEDPRVKLDRSPESSG